MGLWVPGGSHASPCPSQENDLKLTETTMETLSQHFSGFVILTLLLPVSFQKTEWLCLSCQTKRLLEGSLGEPPTLPLPTSQQPPGGAPLRVPGAAPLRQKGPQSLGQSSGPLPTKAGAQAKSLRTPEPSRTPGSVQEKEAGAMAKAEPVPKPPPEAAVYPGTPKAKPGARRTAAAAAGVKVAPEAPAPGGTEVSPTRSPEPCSQAVEGRAWLPGRAERRPGGPGATDGGRGAPRGPGSPGACEFWAGAVWHLVRCFARFFCQ